MTGFAAFAVELKRVYSSAPPRRQLAALHLFAIEHAEAVQAVSNKELLARAGLPESYVTELNKGVILTGYVTITRRMS